MVLIVKCSCDTGDKGSPSQATTALKNAPGITDVGCAFGDPSALEPLVIWFFLPDSQSPKASVGKALLLFSLQLSGIICGLFLFPSLLRVGPGVYISFQRLLAQMASGVGKKRCGLWFQW